MQVLDRQPKSQNRSPIQFVVSSASWPQAPSIRCLQQRVIPTRTTPPEVRRSPRRQLAWTPGVGLQRSERWSAVPLPETPLPRPAAAPEPVHLPRSQLSVSHASVDHSAPLRSRISFAAGVSRHAAKVAAVLFKRYATRFVHLLRRLRLENAVERIQSRRRPIDWRLACRRGTNNFPPAVRSCSGRSKRYRTVEFRLAWERDSLVIRGRRRLPDSELLRSLHLPRDQSGVGRKRGTRCLHSTHTSHDCRTPSLPASDVARSA